MNVAIIGSSGYISGYLIDSFGKQKNINKMVKIDRSELADYYLDLSQAEVFDYSVLDNVDYIIFTAAISGPDQCANEYEECWKINVEGTGKFIDEALKRNCRVLFFSSDAVFGDIPGEIYTESSPTQAKTPYGKMKKAIEDRFKEQSGFKAIRLSYVASKNDKFISYCMKCREKGETVEVFHPFYRNCVVVSDVVRVVEWMINHWNEFPSFVLNVAGKELVSRVRIVDEINRLFQDEIDYRIVSPGSDFYKNRPKTTQMESLYLGQYSIIENTSFTSKIKKELEEIING